jgi:PHD/YefM family antitoxin component YafN of YafNO toxin-antitoxin module
MQKRAAVKKFPASKLNQGFDDLFSMVKLQPVALTKNHQIVAYLISASTHEALINDSTINRQIVDLLNIRAT